jgi:TRAP-type C4-dicarboxylate transport system permease small subunit
MYDILNFSDTSFNNDGTVTLIILLGFIGITLRYLNRKYRDMFPSQVYQRIIFNIVLFLLGAGLAFNFVQPIVDFIHDTLLH